MASITITFTATGQGADNIVIELDEEKNNGKTVFAYGDKAYFRVYALGTSYSIYSTDGTIKKEASLSSTEEEVVSFIEENKARLSKPINSILAYKWFGKELGEITKKGMFEIACSDDVSPSEGKLGIARVKYASNYDLYYVTLPKKDEKEYPVLVVVATEG